MLNRLFGAHIYQVSRTEYQQHGSLELLERVAQKLRGKGRRPYVIPVGGSNWLGTWGYIDSVSEIEKQLQYLEESDGVRISDIVVACGSGGSASGIALGVALSGLSCRVHAFSVCDSPEYFYDFMDQEIYGQSGKIQVNTQNSNSFLFCCFHGFKYVSLDNTCTQEKWVVFAY